MTQVLLVFLGGGLGSLVRYGLARWLNPVNGTLPVGTLLANVAACAFVGLALGWMATRGPWSDNTRLFLVSGFCGGFSTFSTFSAETMVLFQEGKAGWAVAYAVGSVLACLGAAFLGYGLGKQA